MRRLLLFIVAISLAFVQAKAQDTSWSLLRCIEYAKSHNIQIKQSELQERLAKLTLKESQLSRIPNVSGGMNAGYNFGRSIDPTSNQFINNQLFFYGASLNVNMDLFNWFQKDRTVAANKYASEASKQLLQKMQNDVSLNIATAYLQILLDKEQARASEEQVNLSKSQLENTSRQVEAGVLPESNRADLESQLATDSFNLVTANNNFILAILQMKALLNLDFEEPFAVDTVGNLDAIPLISLAANSPAEIYQDALGNQPLIISDSLTELSYQKSVLAAKSALYPSLYLSGSLGTNYSNSSFEFTRESITIPSSEIGTVNVGGTDYTVNSIPEKSFVNVPHKSPFSRQLNNNFNQSIGIGLNIPIFNGWSARGNVERSKINLINQQLTTAQDKLTLKQNIYQAYAAAKGALEKYNASQKALAASQTAFDYATKRYELGLTTSVEYLTTQNTLFKTKTDMLSAKYDYIFKMKLLEFYKSLHLQL